MIFRSYQYTSGTSVPNNPSNNSPIEGTDTAEFPIGFHRPNKYRFDRGAIPDKLRVARCFQRLEKNTAGEASPMLNHQGELYMKLTCLFLTIFLGISAAAQAKGTPFWGAKAPVAYDTPTQNLKKGEFTWAPQLAPEGPILVVVSLDEQRAYAYRNGVQIGASTISSGKKGHETPTGVFHTFLKDADHHSSIYSNAAMPYTQKFTQGGVALHAGRHTRLSGVPRLRPFAQ
jgi:hypothetical protein